MHFENKDQPTHIPGKYVEGKFLLLTGFHLVIRYNLSGFLTVKTVSDTGAIQYIQIAPLTSVNSIEYSAETNRLTIRVISGLYDEYELDGSEKETLSQFLSRLFEV